MKRALLFAHRWLGVAWSSLFAVWFLSGAVMMYCDFPSVTPRDRLARSAPLRASQIALTPAEAGRALGEASSPTEVHVAMYDGRPVYRLRFGRVERVVYADDGRERSGVDAPLMLRVAASWVGLPAAEASVARLDGIDQWTVQSAPDAGPFVRFSWPSGDEVYVSGKTGDVVQHTTRASRLGATFGAIPHWLYVTPLRRRGALWTRVVIGASAGGVIVATLGLVLGVWAYSPRRRYRDGGAASSLPYRGQKRWHAILGLIFGGAAVTWALSGMLSMGPFWSPAPATKGDPGARAVAAVDEALRPGPVPLVAFDARAPRDAIEQLAGAAVKGLELTTFDGEPIYLASLEGGATRVVPLAGPPRAEIEHARILGVVGAATGEVHVTEVTVLDRYDLYYLDRRRERPLPVILARLGDAGQGRVYIDPRTGRLVGSYTAGDWVERWLYHGLHSLDLPWLHEHRPLWDILVLTLLAGGAALSLTSLILAWRVLGRTLRAIGGAQADDLPAE